MKNAGKSEMGEFWSDIREHDAQHRKTTREANTELAERCAIKYDLLLTSFNSGMQLRFTKNGLKLDYFPTAGKIKIGQGFFKADLETTLKTHFGL